MQGLLQAGEHCWREGDGLASRDIGGQDGREPSGGVQGQLATNRMAVDAQAVGHLLAAVRLTTGQQGEQLQPRFLVAVMCMLQASLERGDLYRTIN